MKRTRWGVPSVMCALFVGGGSADSAREFAVILASTPSRAPKRPSLVNLRIPTQQQSSYARANVSSVVGIRKRRRSFP
jgi:hypothetical protein